MRLPTFDQTIDDHWRGPVRDRIRHYVGAAKHAIGVASARSGSGGRGGSISNALAISALGRVPGISRPYASSQGPPAARRSGRLVGKGQTSGDGGPVTPQSGSSDLSRSSELEGCRGDVSGPLSAVFARAGSSISSTPRTQTSR